MKHLILLFIITSGLLITATGCSNECLFRHTNEEILLIDGGYDRNHNRCIEHEEYYEFTKNRAIKTNNEVNEWAHQCELARITLHGKYSSALEVNKARAESASCDAERDKMKRKLYFHITECILAKRRLSWWSRTFGSDIVTEGEIGIARDDLFLYGELRRM